MKRIIIMAAIALWTLPLFAGTFPYASANEAYVIMQDLALWQDEWGGNLKWLEALSIGDKVQLLGKTAKFKQDGKERDYARVKSQSGKEGWVRASYVVSNATLAVVKSDKALVYSEPRDVKVTSRTISPLTLVAVHRDPLAGLFMKVSAWDLAQGSLIEQVWLSTADLTLNDVDVNAIILYRVANAQKNAETKKTLLNLAATKYGSSQFIGRITGAAPSPSPVAESAPKASKPAIGIFLLNDNNVNVRSSPDERNGSVVAVLKAGTEVEVEEVTEESYTIGTMNAPWYQIKEPAGWVYGAFLSPKP